MEPGKITVLCPCCEAKLIIDQKTGALLAHEKPKQAPARSFEQALSEDKKRKQEAEDKFAQAVREQENREELLDKKFKEALKRAEKDDSPPPRPFDFD